MLFSSKLTWANRQHTNLATPQAWSRQHQISLQSGQILECSSAAAFNGDADKANPEELLLAAVSSCHMLSLLTIAEKKRWHVTAYQDYAQAILSRNAHGLQYISEITLAPKISFAASSPTSDQLEKAHQLAHQHCFIANSIKAKVIINLD